MSAIKRRPCLMVAVCALAAQLMAIYSVPWIYAVVTSVVLEIIFLICALTGQAKLNLLWPVIFLTFLSIFIVRVNTVNVSSAEEEAFVSCVSDGVWGCVDKVEEKSAGTYIYISAAKPVSENETLGDKSFGLLVIVDSLEDFAGDSSETGGEIIPGCTLYVQGDGQVIPSATNPGQFDSYKYYRAMGYSFRTFSPTVKVVSEADRLNTCLYRIKRAIAGILEEISCDDDVGVWKAILLGDKAELDEETKSLFQSGGISHILAISGLHISFIGMLLYGLFRKLGLRITISAFVASAILMCYTLLTGASVSAQRACVMMLLTFGATCLGRTPDMLSSMSLAWIIISIRYPYQITQAGCQMSFGAIFALGAFLPALSANIETRKKKGEGLVTKLLRTLLSTLLASISIQLISCPILAWHYFQISVYSLLLNLLVLPLTSVLFGTVLAAVGVGFVCSGLGVNMLPAKIVILPAHLIMAFYRLLCKGSELLPGSILTTGRPRVWQVIIYACVLLVVLIFLELRAGKREIRMEKDVSHVNKKTGRMRGGALEYAICFVSLAVLMAVGLRLLVRVRGSDLTIVYADVGQGDGIFIQCGDLDMFIDGGSSSITSVGTYRIEPLLLYYGVTDVDMWFLTHPDSDHTSGFLEVVETSADAGATRIGSLVINTASAASDEWDEIKTAISEKGISLQLIEAGNSLSTGKLSIECLYPTEIETFTDVNDLCTVLNITYGSVSFLMTGDISSDVEAVLCERYSDKPEKLACTVLKVPHHGSKYSSSEDFLNLINATYAVISCGKNTYGHPSDEAIERIENSGAEIFCTLYDGAVILRCDGERLFLEER